MTTSAFQINYQDSTPIDGLDILTLEQADRIIRRAAQYGVTLDSITNPNYSVTPKPGAALDEFMTLPGLPFPQLNPQHTGA